MTAQTVSAAALRGEKELKLINWLRDQQEDLAMAAASHLKPATIVRVAQGALRRDDKLMAAALANPQSLIHCLLDAARLGHEPGTDQYWLIPFGNEVTGIEGYKGIIERMYRAGKVSSVHAEVVRQKDIYRSMGSRMPPVHEYDEFADPEERGPLRGVYAYAIMDDGLCSQVMRAGKAEVMKHKAMSRGANREDSPWQKWPEPMWKKVPLGALEPYVPTSSEWLMTRARAEAEAHGRAVVAPGWAPPLPSAPAPLQITPGTVEPDEPPAIERPPAQRKQRTQSPPPAPDGPSTPAVVSQTAPEVASAGGDLPPLPGEEDAPGPHAEAGPGAPGDERHRKLVGTVQGHFKRLEFTDDERDKRLEYAAILARAAEIGSLNDLTHEELGDVAAKLSQCRDREALTALLVKEDENGE